MEKLLKLSDTQKLNVVREWYLTIPEILQSEDGLDLEELCENDLDLGRDIKEGTIKKLKLSNLEVLIVVSMWYSNQPIQFYSEDDDSFDDFIMEKIHDMLFKFGKIN
jgi:hypothetical protein